MARPRKYVIKFTEDEYKEFESIIHQKQYAADARYSLTWMNHMEKSDSWAERHVHDTCLAAVTNTVAKYISGGVDAATEFKKA